MAKRKYSDAVRDKAVKLVAGGASYYKAAKEVGAKVSVVRNWCLQKDVKSKHKKKVKKDKPAKAKKEKGDK